MDTKLTLVELNRKHQREFKARQKAKDPDGFRAQRTAEMKEYRAKRKLREASLIPAPINNTPPKTIQLPVIQPPQPAKKQRGRKKTQLVDNPETVPLYKRTNKALEQSSIDDYIGKLNIINNLMTDTPLHEGTKREVIKLLEGKKFLANVIDINLKYLRNISDVVQELRKKYQNDNTFRLYINVLVVIISRMPKYQAEYQQLSKINIQLSKEYSAERDKHQVAPKDEGKIFSFQPQDIQDNTDKLTNINDKMLYVLSIYLLRRLEIRSLILSHSETDDVNNFLIVDKNNTPIKAVFNNYKTKGKFGKQSVNIPDNIKNIVKEYLDTNKIPVGQFIFGQEKDKRLNISQSNFSTKVKTLFTKIYGKEITNRWIRMSYSSFKAEDILDKMKQLEEDAKLLSHSTSTHKQYIKQ